MSTGTPVADHAATTLLEGPRGRRLCLEAAALLDDDVRLSEFWLSSQREQDQGHTVLMSFGAEASFCDFHSVAQESLIPEVSIAGLVEQLAGVQMSDLTEHQLSEAFGSTVNSAMYWQPPDGTDVLAAEAEIRAALVPVAQQLLSLESTRWWADTRAVEQWAIDFRSPHDPVPHRNAGADELLRNWVAESRAEEILAARERPRDVTAAYSGVWWSCPSNAGLVRSVGRIPFGFDAIEDSFGDEEVTATPVRGIGKTFEISHADDWAQLCRDFPLEVTASRRHDWYNVTGLDARWVIPDWSQVAQHWDAVHLSVAGYLQAATRAISIDRGKNIWSVLAGWDPDSTVWLTDSVREIEEPRQHWIYSSDDDEWHRQS